MDDFFFMRHGESQANRDGWLAGHRDSPLSRRGIRQAEDCASSIRSLGPRLVLTSDLLRSTQTAAIVARDLDLPTIMTPALRERSGGQWEGTSISELRAAGRMSAIRNWFARPPQGESLHDVCLRAVGPLLDVVSTSDDELRVPVLVVGHGALIRAIVHALHHGPSGTLSDWKPDNCELVHLRLGATRLEELRTSLEKAKPHPAGA